MFSTVSSRAAKLNVSEIKKKKKQEKIFFIYFYYGKCFQIYRKTHTPPSKYTHLLLFYEYILQTSTFYIQHNQ